MRRPPFAAVALAFTLAACSGPAERASKDGEASATAAATSSSTSSSSSGTRTPTPTATSSVGASASPATPAQRALAPRAGVYTYRQSGSYSSPSGARAIPSTGTLKIHAPTAAAVGVHQRHERAVSNDRKSTYTYRFTTAGVWILHVVSDGFECTLSEPLRVLTFPLRAGQHLDGEANCRKFPSVTFRVTEDVLRSEPRAVGGSTIDTFVIRSTIDVEAGAFSQSQDSTTWVSPAYRLVVRSATKISSATYSADVTENLVSLTPR